MCTLFTALIAFLFTGLANSQTQIRVEEAVNHLGDSVTVCGKVAGACYLRQANGSPIFLTWERLTETAKVVFSETIVNAQSAL